VILFSNSDRPFHWGPYPMERLSRDPAVSAREAARPAIERPVARPAADTTLAHAIARYHAMFRDLGVLAPLPPKAPVPDDLARRTQDVKGAIYFLDAAQAGICKLPEAAWYAGAQRRAHDHAIVILVARGRMPEADNLAHDWVKGSEAAGAELRAFEIAIAIAEHIQCMGFDARAHDGFAGSVDLDRLTVMAGLGHRTADGVTNPYLGRDFALACVTTEYALACDEPLADSARNAKGLGWWLGLGGSTPGIEWNRRKKRATHLSDHPMEQVTRVDRPTTLILDDEVPQIPKRAEFFERAARGDLGDKAKAERSRFAFKHPFARAMVSLIRTMAAEQDGVTAPQVAHGFADASANAKAIKSLSYFLGSQLTGICEIPRYAWYANRKDGTKIPYNHKYAVVMLIDQGYETMEGASGDDYISGAQSMRAYMRGAEIAGVMAEHLRALGFGSRSQTNADSDVLHVPLMLLAGLGELSRIGEVVLNPFMGPRLKTVVMTTDFPLEPDKPIDFGLQYFCSNCTKCARECPCDAISWGNKVMYNGYEMWKPDVERCTRYRLTNPKGLACGRCMKTCPLNKVVTWEGPVLARIASWFGVNVRWMKPLLVPIATKLDDLLGHGVRNPVKKWWLDLEWTGKECILPPKGVNQRDLNLAHKIDPKDQKMAYYHANAIPPADLGTPMPVDRKAAMAAGALLETPDQARARRASGGAKPAHYNPTPPLNDEDHRAPLESAHAIWDINKKPA